MASINSADKSDHVHVTSTPADNAAVNGGPTLVFGKTSVRSTEEGADLVSVEVSHPNNDTSTNSPHKPSNNTAAKKRNKTSK